MCDHSKQNRTKPHTQAAALAGFQDPIRQTMGGPCRLAGVGGRKPVSPSLGCPGPEQGQQQVEAGNGIDQLFCK